MKDKPLTRQQIAEAEQRIRDYQEHGKPLFRTCLVYESSKDEPGILVKGLKIFDFDGASVRVVIRNGRNARTTPGGSASDRR